MRIGIVQFPGSNCERETILAVQRAGMEPVEFLWNESHQKLKSLDGYIIVGGFSYEDRSRSGIIAALDPVMLELKAQSEQGKPILGICNGAQILVETGLVPGLESNKLAMALAENKRIDENGKILGTGFYNAWIHLRLADEYQRNAFTRHLTPKDILHIPTAHGEGRFVMTDALLQEVMMQGLQVFQYCNEHGEIIDNFPVNPNGSIKNIAAIANKNGNVMAIMPHPERTPNGDAIFHSMRDYIAEGKMLQHPPLGYYPRRYQVATYQKPDKTYECVVELMITDNHALTVQNTLRQLGIPVKVQRQVHWEIQCSDQASYVKLKSTGVLFNERKELARDAMQVLPASKTYLVRAKEDLLGKQKCQTLHDHFALQEVVAIQHGVLWQFSCDQGNIHDWIEQILSTHIIFNPYSHDCYEYNTTQCN